MQAADLTYQNLVGNVLNGYLLNGRTESASFLAWFLENIYRLDDVTAADAICDGPGDRGVDAIYIDADNSEIVFLQSKVRQNDNRRVGDQPIRDFAGSIGQFQTPEQIEAAIEAEPQSELAKLLVRTDLRSRLAEGYVVKAVFVTNAEVEEAGATAANALNVTIYDRNSIAEGFIELEAPDRVLGQAVFDVSDNGFLEFAAGGDARLFLITPKAHDLMHLSGLADGTLFAQNVRLGLGNTKVNRDIAKTVSDRTKHLIFPMYHNGITLVCRNVDTGNTEQLSVTDYVVVNGAQSLSVLYRNRDKISDDLRLIVKVIEIGDDDGFVKDITIASNNQNSIKPRDMRSTNLLQTRLQEEFQQIRHEDYSYVIKRGEEAEGNVISNEEAGRILLAFDVGEPWSCHQIYKVFDEKYSEIFGRPIVNAWRIILLSKIAERVEAALPEIRNEPLQRYRLTRYFLLHALSNILKEDDGARAWLDNPEALLKDEQRLETCLSSIESIARRFCVDLRFEFIEGDSPPDYKAALKSPVQVTAIEERLRRSFLHDVARGRETLPSALN